MISFFTRPGGAGIIRGKQISEYIDGKLNPIDGYENDICIYIKCVPPKNYPKHTYVDVIEDSAGLRWAKSHPDVGIIASSKSMYDHLRLTLKNKIVFIPQHHCNFEQWIRPLRDIKVAGIIGNKAAFQYPLDKLRERLEYINIELKTLIKHDFQSREEIVEFYKNIDIQLVWRPENDTPLRNPLKIINAMSYGIPTVAYPEITFVEECSGLFSEATTIDKLIQEVKWLKDALHWYYMYARVGVHKSVNYHIDTISKLYLQLK